MNLHRLQLFCEVVEQKGFTAASERLTMSQASVHLQVRELERELGAKLLERAGRRMLPTEAGEEVYRVARHMLADSEQLKVTLSDLRSGQVGRIVAGVSSAASYLLIPALSRFRTERPNVDVSVTVAHSKVICERVNWGELHFGVVLRRGVPTKMAVQPLLERRLVLVARCDHPFSVQKWAEPVDLERTSVVFGSTAQRQVIEHALANVGIYSLREGMEVDTLGAQLEAVRSGAGVAFLPEHTIRIDVASGLLRIIRLRGVDMPTATYVLVSRHGRVLSPVVSDAIAFVVREVTDTRSETRLSGDAASAKNQQVHLARTPRVRKTVAEASQPLQRISAPEVG